jgi:hypothetical protein
MSPEEANAPPPSAEAAPTAAPSLLKVVEALTKMSAALAVFGYLSLRSHLNTLGISSTTSLGVERYLAELPEIVGIIFFPLLALGIPLAILCLLGATSLYLKHRIAVKWPHTVWLFKLREILLAGVLSVEAPILVSAGVLFLGWFTLFAQSSGGSTGIGLAVGELSRSHKPDGWAAFFIILYGCVVAYLLCHGCRRYAERHQGNYVRLWYLPMGLVACVALQLPVLYGRTLHNSDYAKARIDLAREKGSSQPEMICGLVLLRENSDLLLWQVQDTVGSIRAIPSSEIKQLVTGESADIWELIGKTGRREAISLCPAGSFVSDEGNP